MTTLRAAARAGMIVSLVAAVGALVRASDAETAPAHAVKAAFLLNFARFVEWPSDADPGGPFVLCVAGDAAVADALERMGRDATIGGRGLTVWRIEQADPIEACRVLYASGLDQKKSLELLSRTTGAAVFTVSDFERFATVGGVAHFFVEDGRMRFAINIDAAQRARLRISSQVLNLARIVREDHAQ